MFQCRQFDFYRDPQLRRVISLLRSKNITYNCDNFTSPAVLCLFQLPQIIENRKLGIKQITEIMFGLWKIAINAEVMTSSKTKMLTTKWNIKGWKLWISLNNKYTTAATYRQASLVNKMAVIGVINTTWNRNRLKAAGSKDYRRLRKILSRIMMLVGPGWQNIYWMGVHTGRWFLGVGN